MQTIGTVIDADTTRRRLHVAVDARLWQVQLTVEVYGQGAAIICLERAGLDELRGLLLNADIFLGSLDVPHAMPPL